MVDVAFFFIQDCVRIIRQPIVQIADILLGDGWPCPDLRMLEN